MKLPIKKNIPFLLIIAFIVSHKSIGQDTGNYLLKDNAQMESISVDQNGDGFEDLIYYY
jgi:hypothetical protein